MKATEILKEEHRQIKRMLAILNHVADRISEGGEVQESLLRDAVHFVRNFADRLHHGKEEAELFPALVTKGMPEQGPIGQMLVEHVSGREFIGQLNHALERYNNGDEAARSEIVEAIRGYTALLGRHIQKEDMILFSMADKLLSPEDDEELFDKYCKVDRELTTKEELSKWNNLLDRYESEFGLPKIADEDAKPGCLAFSVDADTAIDEIVKGFKKP